MDEQIKPSKEYEASFNLALYLTEEIAGSLKSASQYYSSGNLVGYFNSLTVVQRRIDSFLNKEEKEQCDNMGEEISNLIRITGEPLSTVNVNYHIIINKTRKMCSERLKEYDRLIMFLLRKYGLLIPPKRDKSVLIG